MNCMEIFHYVSDQLKDVPLFEATSYFCKQNDGAIYNDFDNPTPFGDQVDQMLSFSSQNMDLLPVSGNQTRTTVDSLVTRTEVEHAIMESDRIEGNWNEDMVFNTDAFQYGGEIDEKYMSDVYTLLTKEEKVLDELSERALEIFNIRRRNNWAIGDTVYDAWLLRSGYERQCFRKEQFILDHPDLEIPVTKSIEEAKTTCKFTPVSPCRKRRRISSSSDSDSNGDGDTSESSLSTLCLLPRQSDDLDSAEGGLSPSLATRSSQPIDKKPSQAELKRFVASKNVTDEVLTLSDDDNKSDVWFEVTKYMAPKEISETINISSDDE